MLRKHDYGFVMTLNLHRDLTGFEEIRVTWGIKNGKPVFSRRYTEGYFDMVSLEDGTMTYVVRSGDLEKAGHYVVQATVIYPGPPRERRSGMIDQFVVGETIDGPLEDDNG